MTYREAKGLLAAVKVRMQDIKQFYLHLVAYVGVNASVLTINFMAPETAPAVLLTALPWGFFLGRHAFKVFGRKGKQTRAWEKEFLQELMDGAPLPDDRENLLPPHDENEIIRMRKRIENLEAILTSHPWEEEKEKVS